MNGKRARTAATREALLRAGRETFARRGYDGASIREITRRAHANLGAVTYHFGGKRQLYHQVLASFAEPLGARLAEAPFDPAPPLDRISAILNEFFAALLDQRDLPALMLHELALNKPAPPPVRRTMERVFQLLVDQIQSGQEDGSIQPGPPPPVLAMNVVAQPIYVALLRHRLKDVFGLDVSDPAFRHALVTYTAGFVRRGLSAGDEA
jgi:AcrR family transcriptional regulator